MLDNTDIEKNVTPYFVVHLYVQMFCNNLLHSNIYSKCGNGRLLLNVVSFVYVDFVYICNLYSVFMNVCFVAYIGISTFI